MDYLTVAGMNGHLQNLPRCVLDEFDFCVVVAHEEFCFRGGEEQVGRSARKSKNQMMIFQIDRRRIVEQFVAARKSGKLAVGESKFSAFHLPDKFVEARNQFGGALNLNQ